jgi:hypothetical protein
LTTLSRCQLVGDSNVNNPNPKLGIQVEHSKWSLSVQESSIAASNQTVECIDAEATEAQPKAGAQETVVNGDSPCGSGDDDFRLQMAAELFRNVSKWAVADNTLRH